MNTVILTAAITIVSAARNKLNGALIISSLSSSSISTRNLLGW